MSKKTIDIDSIPLPKVHVDTIPLPDGGKRSVKKITRLPTPSSSELAIPLPKTDPVLVQKEEPRLIIQSSKDGSRSVITSADVEGDKTDNYKSDKKQKKKHKEKKHKHKHKHKEKDRDREKSPPGKERKMLQSKELLQRELITYRANAGGKDGDKSGEMSQTIVDELFKDFIATKMNQIESEYKSKDKSESKEDVANSVEEMNRLLDDELDSLSQNVVSPIKKISKLTVVDKKVEKGKDSSKISSLTKEKVSEKVPYSLKTKDKPVKSAKGDKVSNVESISSKSLEKINITGKIKTSSDKDKLSIKDKSLDKIALPEQIKTSSDKDKLSLKDTSLDKIALPEKIRTSVIVIDSDNDDTLNDFVVDKNKDSSKDIKKTSEGIKKTASSTNVMEQKDSKINNESKIIDGKNEKSKVLGNATEKKKSSKWDVKVKEPSVKQNKDLNSNAKNTDLEKNSSSSVEKPKLLPPFICESVEVSEKIPSPSQNVINDPPIKETDSSSKSEEGIFLPSVIKKDVDNENETDLSKPVDIVIDKTKSVKKQMAFKIGQMSTEIIAAAKDTEPRPKKGKKLEEGEVLSSNDEGSVDDDDDDEDDEEEDSDSDDLDDPSETGSLSDSDKESDKDTKSSKAKKKKKKKNKKRKKKKKRKSKDKEKEKETDKDKEKEGSSEKKIKRKHSSRSKSRTPKKSKKSYSRSPERKSRKRSRSSSRDRSRDRGSDKSKDKNYDPEFDAYAYSSDKYKYRDRDYRDRDYRGRDRDRYQDRRRSRSRSSDRYRSRDRDRRRSRSRSRSREKDKYKDDSDLRVKIDKAKLREIAIKNALAMAKAGDTTILPQLDLVTIKAGGKSVEELTDFCKRISSKEKPKRHHESSSESESESSSGKSDEEDDSLIHHPFKLKEMQSAIVMNIRNAKPLPILSAQEKITQQSTLRLQFPVSSGSTHRIKESEWVPVEKTTTSATTATTETTPQNTTANGTATATTATTTAPTTTVTQDGAVFAVPAPPPPPPSLMPSTIQTASEAVTELSAISNKPMPKYGIEHPVKPKPQESIFPDAPKLPLDIGSIIAERVHAVRQLASNPHDLSAMSKIAKAQEKASQWAQSKYLPGQFIGSTGAQILSQEELMGPDKKRQAWVKKDQLAKAAPLRGGIGMALLQKMGWKQGEGLGKNNEGSLEPLALDFKTDRKGLTSVGENKNKKSVHTPLVRDLSGKHPVSALVELCNKRKWGPPNFLILDESGPDHHKAFQFKVIVNGTEYLPAVASNSKKGAKYNAASVCLQELGLIPRDSPMMT